MAYSKKDILALAKKQNVKFVDYQFTDMLGVVKGITQPVEELEGALDHGVWFDGSSIEGFTRIYESDMYLVPDLGTWRVIPWTKDNPMGATARFICDVYMPDGTPFVGDPRGILRRHVEIATKLGYLFNTGPELEFFLFRRDANGQLAPLAHDTAGYFDLSTDLAVNIRQEMTQAMQDFGIHVEALHHEVAIGQHEIDFRYGDALTTADSAITMRYVLKHIAHKHGLHCTFMPKPIAGINGSGMHVHQSLFSLDGKTNLFFDKKDAYHVSKLCKSYIAGQMEHIKAMTAIMNPTVNSYKRLVVGYEAPVYVAWGQRNRSALIRIPRYTPGRDKAVRCELRCPDPTANPYLAFAVMLAAGLDGIKRKLNPPAPVEDNIFEFTDETAAKHGITTVAKSLPDALEALKNDSVVRGALGEHTFAKFYEAKMSEWDSFRLSVTQWEIDKYLEVY
jgi:glutamine synthetase